MAICFGGNSVEHDVSIVSAIQMAKSIDRKKYDYVMIYISHDNHFYVGPNFDDLETFKNKKFTKYEVVFYKTSDQKVNIMGLKKFIPKKYIGPFDVVIPIVHGKNIEDGTLAGFLKMFDASFSSTDVLGSSVLQDKIYTKKILESEGIDVVDYIYFDKIDWYKTKETILKYCETIVYPLIVKPSNLGSSIGIEIANDSSQLETAIVNALKYDDRILVEKELTAYREFNCGYLGYQSNYEVSEVEEVISKNNYLTFSDKYQNEGIKILNPDIPTKLYNQITQTTIDVARLFNTKGVIRVDYLYDIENDKLYVNEINTIPGSLAFNLFEARDIYFNQIIDCLVNIALDSNYYQKSLKNQYESEILNHIISEK